MLFWTVAILLALAASSAVIASLLRTGSTESSDLDSNLTVYQRLLREIGQDLLKGSIAREEAEQTTLEVKRRMLRAARQHGKEGPPRQAPRMATWLASGASFLILVPGSVAIYLLVGSHGYPDQPRSVRMEAAETAYAERPSLNEYLALTRGGTGLPRMADTAEPSAAPSERDADGTEMPASITDLRASLREAAGLGDLDAAISIQGRINSRLGGNAPASDRLRLAEMYIHAADGYVSPEAERELTAALDRAPGNSRARYFMGLLALQVGRPDRALEAWVRILQETDPEDPVRELVLIDLNVVADLAGVDRQRLAQRLQLMNSSRGRLPGQAEPTE